MGTVYCTQHNGGCMFLARYRVGEEYYCGYCVKRLKVTGRVLDEIKKVEQPREVPVKVAKETGERYISPLVREKFQRMAAKRWGAKRVSEVTEETGLVVAGVTQAKEALIAVKVGTELPVHFEVRILHKDMAGLEPSEMHERERVLLHLQRAVKERGYGMRPRVRKVEGYTRWEFWRLGTPAPHRW